ncbi:MAG TPA: hypothetical protein VJ792_07870 [Candidatus Nitrosotalea sp.]|nr:hypothetical protein [Candidatus Nitrosotalea sp.]
MHSVIDTSAKLGRDVKIGDFVTIGRDVLLGDNVKIEDGARIFHGCRIGNGSIIGPNAILRPNTVIGQGTIFGSCSVSEGENKVGNNTTIHAQCHITSSVEIGDNCFIAPFFIASNTPDISSGTHGTAKTERGKKLPTRIEDHVRIGICVSMTPGHTIGHHSEIYQNCLITKDIPPYSIVKGGKDQVGRVIGKNAPNM